jgi:hypothetical protein
MFNFACVRDVDVLEEIKAQASIAAANVLGKMESLIKHNHLTDAFTVLQLPFWIEHNDTDEDILFAEVKEKVEVLRLQYAMPAYFANGIEVPPLISSSGLDQELSFFIGRRVPFLQNCMLRNPYYLV